MSEDISDEYFSITRKLNILETSVGINTQQINFLNKNLNQLVTDGIKVVDEENEPVQIELATGTAAGAGTNGLTEVNFSPHWANHLANIPAGGGGTGTNSLATGTAAGAVANGLTEVNFTPTLATKLNGIQDGANFKTIGDGGLTQNNFTNALKNKLDGISIGANVGILSLSQDNSPTLGADLDVSTFGIKSSSNRNIEISPNGSGIVKIKGNTGGSGQIQLNCEDNSHGVKIKGPPHSAGASYTLTLPDDDGTADQVLKTDGSGKLSWTTQSSGGILSLFQDNSPTLSANLDVNGHDISNAHKIYANEYYTSHGYFLTSENQASFKALELKPSSGSTSGLSGETFLADGDTGNVQMSGTLSVDTITEKSTGNGVDISGVNVSSSREITNAHKIYANEYYTSHGYFLTSENQASFKALELKPSSGSTSGLSGETFLADGDTGNVQMSGTLSVDTINEKGTNNDISITPTGTGNVVLHNLKWPSSDGSANYVLKTDGSGNLSWTAQSSGGGGGIASLSADPNPTLGADLDLNGKVISNSSGDIVLITGNPGNRIDLSGPVNMIHADMTGTLSVDTINENGTNNDISITPTGTGNVVLHNLKWPSSDGSANYVLKTDGSGNLSWTAQSSGGGGGGSSYITTDNEQAVSYYPQGPSGPSYSEPTESLKLEGNLRLDKNSSGTSGSLVVEDELVIKSSSTASSSSFNSLYNYSAFNHAIGPVVDNLNASNPAGQWGATNIILGDTNRITSNKITALESSNEIHLAITDGPFSSSKAQFFLQNDESSYPGRASMRFDSNRGITVNVGKYDGSDSPPTDVNGNVSSFQYTLHAGGYDPNHSTPYTQQPGAVSFFAGTQIELASPDVYIGSSEYGAADATHPPANSTNNVIIKANTRVDIQSPELMCNDINIKGALLTNGDAGNAGYVLTSGGGSGNPMNWMPGLLAWNEAVNAGFRSTQQIDMMGETIVLGATNGGWYPTAGPPTPNPVEYFWNFPHNGFDKNSIDNGQNYTRRIHNNSQDIFISSSPNPSWSFTTEQTFIPDNRIHLSARHHQTNGKPEIILEVDKEDPNVNETLGIDSPNAGYVPSGGVFPKIRLCAGKWSDLHVGNPFNQTQNAGFLHMSAGSSAALLSRRIYIGKQKAGLVSSSLGLIHDGYGPEFNPWVNGQQYQDAFDPTIGQSETQILSLSSERIEIFSTNTVEFHGQVSANQQILNSDDRLKHNEEDLTNSLDVIRKLKPQKYQKTKTLKKADFNGTLEEGSYINESGFIAQDILNIPELAYCVTGGDFTKTSKDSEGVEKEVIIEKPYSVNYNDIFTRNVSATQELDTIVTNLLTKIATLEARITELENK